MKSGKAMRDPFHGHPVNPSDARKSPVANGNPRNSDGQEPEGEALPFDGRLEPLLAAAPRELANRGYHPFPLPSKLRRIGSRVWLGSRENDFGVAFPVRWTASPSLEWQILHLTDA